MEGVQSQPGFDVLQERIGLISDQQKFDLMKINHQLNLRYQLLTEYVRQTKTFEISRSDPAVLELVDLSMKSDFGRQMAQLLDAGKISRDEFLGRLQEESYWQTRLAH